MEAKGLSLIWAVGAKPDYNDWINTPTWHAWEAVMLLADIRPEEDVFNEFVKNRHKWERSCESQIGHTQYAFASQVVRFYRCLKVIQRAVVEATQYANPEYVKNFPSHAFDSYRAPYDFIEIAKKYDLEIPSELAGITKPAEKETKAINYWRRYHPIWWLVVVWRNICRNKIWSVGVAAISVLGGVAIWFLNMLNVDYSLAWTHLDWLWVHVEKLIHWL